MHNAAPNILDIAVDKARHVAGSLALTAALVGSIANMTNASMRRAKPDVLFGEHLIQPDALPGHNIGITTHAASLLADASVKVYQTPIEETGYADPTLAWCSGVKVRVGDQTYISLAAHCFEAETLIEDGVLNPLNFPLSDGALDFFNRSHYTYTIEDSAVPPLDRQTLATVDGIAISTDSIDAALLKVTANTPTTNKTGQTGPDYQQLGTVPYMRQANLTPGQKVAMYSSPESTDNEPIKIIGTYIGIDHVQTGYYGKGVSATRPVDVVLIHPKQPYQDVCYFGGSGSDFVARETRHGSTAGLHGEITESGPLSGRINSLYDPYLDPPIFNANPETQLKESVAEEKTWRTDVEFQLGVAISPKDTICEYSVVGSKTKNALVNAFDNFAPPLPLKGGGG